MKRIISVVLVVSLLMTSLFSTLVYAEQPENPEDGYETLVHFDIVNDTEELIQVSTTLEDGDIGISPGFVGNAPLKYYPDTKSVINGDNRYTVQNLDQVPYRFIGTVTAIFPGNYTKKGTGFLVDKNVILTTADLLYVKENGEAQEIIFTPAEDKFSLNHYLPYGDAMGSDIYVSQNYKTAVNNRRYVDIAYRYGIVKLTTTIGMQTGFFGLAVHDSTPGALDGVSVTVAGYDEDFHMRKQPGSLLHSSGGEMYYQIDTSKNQLGGPVYNNNTYGGTYILMGINVKEGTEEGENYNSGRVITEALYNTIKKKIDK